MIYKKKDIQSSLGLGLSRCLTSMRSRHEQFPSEEERLKLRKEEKREALARLED